jgi:carbonic anhydrase/acetyltransferase-like protein (isoleucine patch superfamily)
MAQIDPSAWVAPSAVVTGDVTVGAGSRVLHGAVLTGDAGPVTIGADVLVMENAVLRGRADHPLTIGDAVLVGPHAHLNGATVEDEVFIATGVSVFAGARVGHGSELRINSVLHVRSTLLPGTVVPIGWIAAGDPAEALLPRPPRRPVGGSGAARLPRHDVRRTPRHPDADDHARAVRPLRP